mgnify:CR=1 FL=1|jgi:hypothetical protein
MVRIASILLIIIYGFSATGATVHLHYCCGTAQNLVVQLEKDADHLDCPLCLSHETETPAGTDSTDCCSDKDCGDHVPGHCHDIKVETGKTAEKHLPGGDGNLVKIYPLELLVFTLSYLAVFPEDVQSVERQAMASPPRAIVPLFIKHCTYLI